LSYNKQTAETASVEEVYGQQQSRPISQCATVNA